MNIDKICAAIRDAFSEAEVSEIKVLDDNDTCAVVSVVISLMSGDDPMNFRTMHKDLYIDADGEVIAI